MHIPEGYQLFEWVAPFEELVGPLCFKEDADGGLRFVFEAQPKHANTSGQIHGGMLMTFADFVVSDRHSWTARRAVRHGVAELRVHRSGSGGRLH